MYRIYGSMTYLKRERRRERERERERDCYQREIYFKIYSAKDNYINYYFNKKEIMLH